MSAVPPSDEVQRQEMIDHVRTCPCSLCGTWRYVQEIVADGTPEQRLATWRALTALLHDLAPAVVLDALGDV